MKSQIKRGLKAAARRLARLGAPLARPFARKFDARLMRLMSLALREHRPEVHVRVDPPDFSRIEAALGEMRSTFHQTRQVSEHHASEANILMDSLVREVARLQMQVEDLTEQVEILRSGDDLAVVGDAANTTQLRAG